MAEFTLNSAEVKLAARLLLDDDNFKTVFNAYLGDLRACLIEAQKDQEIVDAHRKFTTFKDFIEDLENIALKPKGV